VLVGKLANIGLFIASCLLVHAIGEHTELALGGRCSRISGAVTQPDRLFQSVCKRAPFIISTLGFVFYYIKAHRQGKFPWNYVIAAALFLAAGYYVKPQIILIPAGAFLLLLAISRKTLRRNVATNALVHLVVAVAAAPWIARNLYYFDRVIPISTNGGINLYIGNNPFASGAYRWDGLVTKPLEGMSEYERDREASRLAKQFIQGRPLGMLKPAPVKLWFLLKTDSDGIAWNEAGLVANESWKKVAMLALKLIS
jgi:4-amino-4-deoxy-L-arabinose transferase-like glycosyltransferase